MLTRLHIRNYAIIEKVNIDFSNNLTIITGETGAGKSILLGALNLIMGERADTKVLYNLDEKCVVEAFFDIKNYDLKTFFDDNELDYEPELVIRREINTTGKSRAFINDTPAQLGVVKQLTGALIDLHQQFDSLDIHNVSFQLRMIDALAGNHALLPVYETAYKRFAADRRKLDALIAQSKSGAKEMEFMLFQLNELTEANLQIGEQEELEAELKTLSNAENIKQNLAAAHDALTENEQAIVGGLRSVAQHVAAVKQYHKALPEIYERLEAARIDLQELGSDLGGIIEDTEFDPERIMELQDRLNVLYKLQKKHQLTEVAELIALRNELAQKTDGFADLSGTIEQLQKGLELQAADLRSKAAELSTRRKAQIPDFEEKVHAMLRPLSMPYAVFNVQITELAELSATGIDRINFLFAANKGGRLEAIKDVASGGEISRLTLCTKSLVASAIPLPTLIFDEIDTGVSGDVALKMGKILHGLARQHQVVCITHTPQVAAKADTHYFVYKEHGEDRTVTAVRALTHPERVTELATMLSGNPPSAAAMSNAKELLM